MGAIHHSFKMAGIVLVFAACFAPGSAFADVTVDFTFSAVGQFPMTGSATYADVDTAEPTSFSFIWNGVEFSDADMILGPWDTQWSGGVATQVAPSDAFVVINDATSTLCIVLGGDGSVAVGTESGGFPCAGPAFGAPQGTFVLTTTGPPPPPEVDLPAIGPVGIALLFSALGVAGYRRLRS